MILSDEDNKKVYENLDEIIEWLENKRKNVELEIDISIPSSYSTTKLLMANSYCLIVIGGGTYFLIDDNGEYNRSFKESGKIDTMINLIKDWDNIKNIILKDIKKQKEISTSIKESENYEKNETIKLIRNFKV